MPGTMLKDENWTRLRPILLELSIYDKGNLRQTVEGILYRMRVGCPWRDLPEYFGKPNTIYKAYQRWFRSNKLIALFALLIKDSDCEWVFIDGTHIKAHQHSSGAHDNPITFLLSDGTTHDVKVASDLIDKMDLSDTVIVCADKGHDSEALRAHIKQAGCANNIPRKQNTKSTNEHMDWDLYKARHLVENAFAKLKNYRAVATRFDKLKQSYENTVALACAYLWLKL
ncbi:IS5/IS1182 family transposase [Psychrobacter urativorans]|uniref:Transposase n=1 Tax=Psychrobacter urativorans TaxID=45610 RepID=A0A0M3V986_9GAMM|nr:IS5/IS1182 family transposase [Psychrobacter urativorans]ALF60513.1 transposase [Psychrobacter urativorans]